MKIKLTAILSVFILIISCNKDSKVNDPEVNDSNLLLGIWESEYYQTLNGETVYVFSKSEKLNETVSIIFEENDVFKSWDYGWCGTPPLHFYTTVGNYQLHENDLKVDVDAFTIVQGALEIIELTSDTLKLIRL